MRTLDRAACVELMADAFAQDNVRPAGGCLLWTGPTATVRVCGGRARVQRVAWTAHHGADPGPLFITKTCGVRSCVSPAHMVAATTTDATTVASRPGWCSACHEPIEPGDLIVRQQSQTVRYWKGTHKPEPVRWAHRCCPQPRAIPRWLSTFPASVERTCHGCGQQLEVGDPAARIWSTPKRPGWTGHPACVMRAHEANEGRAVGTQD